MLFAWNGERGLGSIIGFPRKFSKIKLNDCTEMKFSSNDLLNAFIFFRINKALLDKFAVYSISLSTKLASNSLNQESLGFPRESLKYLVQNQEAVPPKSN